MGKVATIEDVARIIVEPSMLRAHRRCLLVHATDALARLYALARQARMGGMGSRI